MVKEVQSGGMPDEIISVDSVAILMGVSRQTVRILANQRKIVCIKMSNRYHAYALSSVIEHLQVMAEAAKAKSDDLKGRLARAKRRLSENKKKASDAVLSVESRDDGSTFVSCQDKPGQDTKGEPCESQPSKST